MTDRIVIRTPATPAEVAELVRDLPKILSGRSQKHAAFRNRFWAVFAQEFMRRVRRGYQRKSWRAPDDLGNHFKAIKPKTIKRKSKKHMRHGILLPPAKYPNARNRDTDDLFNSLAAGKVTGDSYVPVKNQICKMLTSSITLGSTLHYAEDALRERPAFPPGYSQWVNEAAVAAIKKTMHLLERK